MDVTYGNYIGGIGGLKIQNVGVWLNKNSKKRNGYMVKNALVTVYRIKNGWLI